MDKVYDELNEFVDALTTPRKHTEPYRSPSEYINERKIQVCNVISHRGNDFKKEAVYRQSGRTIRGILQLAITISENPGYAVYIHSPYLSHSRYISDELKKILMYMNIPTPTIKHTCSYRIPRGEYCQCLVMVNEPLNLHGKFPDNRRGMSKHYIDFWDHTAIEVGCDRVPKGAFFYEF